MKREVAIIPGASSIKEAIQLIERSRFETGFTVDETGKYLGAVAINDLRRLLISGVNEADIVREQPCAHQYAVRDKDLRSEKVIANTISDLTLKESSTSRS
jgi:CBS domain-containing protein